MRSVKRACSCLDHSIFSPNPHWSLWTFQSLSWAAVATRSDLKLKHSRPMIDFGLTPQAEKAKCCIFLLQSLPQRFLLKNCAFRLPSSQIYFQSCLHDFMHVTWMLWHCLACFKCIVLYLYFYYFNIVSATTKENLKNNASSFLFINTSTQWI